MTKTITLVGFGNMGRALAAGWVAAGYSPGDITVVDSSRAALAAAADAGFKTADEPQSADVVVLAVKPDQLDAVIGRHAGLPKGTVFLSIAAGRTIAGLAAGLGAQAAIVRAMPNTPAAIGRGVTGLCASAAVTQAQRTQCESLMAAVGSVVWVDDEALMDAITAVSGSGPAYVFLLIEALSAAGRELGLEAGTAAALATHTVAGAGQYALGTDTDAAELRRRVTSPKGTTEAALDVLMTDGAFTALIGRAVAAAARRSRELSG